MNIINENDLLVIDGHHLDVWKWFDGKNSGLGVQYQGAYVKDGIIISSTFGRGQTFNEAINDYYRQIKGKTLVFNPDKENRCEVRVI